MCTSRCRTTAAPSTCRARPSISTICRSRSARMHIAVGGSPVARGTIRRIDLAEVLSTPGVVAVITAAHIPGKNDISPGHADEPVFAHDRVDFHGQPIFAVIATSRDTARRAALLGEIEIDAEQPNVSVEQGKASGERVLPDYAFVNGDVAKAVAAAPLSHRRRVAYRRPGALLSGRPNRDGRARRGRRGAGLFVHPASERSAAHRRPRSGVARTRS